MIPPLTAFHALFSMKMLPSPLDTMQANDSLLAHAIITYCNCCFYNTVTFVFSSRMTGAAP